MIESNKLRELYEDVITSMAYIGYFETKQKTTWHRLLRRDSDGSEVFVTVYDGVEPHADTPIMIRFKEKVINVIR